MAKKGRITKEEENYIIAHKEDGIKKIAEYLGRTEKVVQTILTRKESSTPTETLPEASVNAGAVKKDGQIVARILDMGLSQRVDDHLKATKEKTTLTDVNCIHRR